MAFVLRKSERWATLEAFLAAWKPFEWFAGNTAAGDEMSLGRALVAIHVHRAFDDALAEMASHAYAHHDYEGRPTLVAVWYRALGLREEARLGRDLTVLERKHLKYANPPPSGVGAINLPSFTGPQGVSWP